MPRKATTKKVIPARKRKAKGFVWTDEQIAQLKHMKAVGRVYVTTTNPHVRPGASVFSVGVGDVQIGDCVVPLSECDPSTLRCEAIPEKPMVESYKMDLNRYVLEHVLPGAAQMCEEGKQREIAQERDIKRGERSTIWFVEVSKGRFETTSPLPHGMPPLRWEGRPSEANWLYCIELVRHRVAKGEAARKMARETTFLQAGSGVQG